MLRPRYRPDWVPSWHATGDDLFMCEDGKNIIQGHVLDATRIADGAVVTLKRVLQPRFPHEIDIATFLSSGPLASDGRNHCVPVLDVLDVPGDGRLQLVVMPLLREFDDPRFRSVGEVLECCRQLIEGLEFIHAQHVAHRDCGRQNIMMDPRGLLPDLFHFAAPWRSRDMSRYVRHSTRTRRPVKYYFIDFGLARRYDPAAGPPRAWPIFGGDKTVPEFAKSLEPCDPIPTDVYYLGNAMHTAFLRDFVGAEVLQPLVADMVQDDPSRRPAMSEVAARFDVLMGTLGSWTLRARLVPRGEHWVVRCFRASAHAVRTLWYILTLRSALPRP